MTRMIVTNGPLDKRSVRGYSTDMTYSASLERAKHTVLVADTALRIEAGRKYSDLALSLLGVTRAEIAAYLSSRKSGRNPYRV